MTLLHLQSDKKTALLTTKKFQKLLVSWIVCWRGAEPNSLEIGDGN
jgi:hypothetical protein